MAFADLPGWADDDLGEAFAAFRASARRLVDHPPTAKPLGPDAAALVRAARTALSLGDAIADAGARAFFESAFEARRIQPAQGRGFVTGYFEPEVAASAAPSPTFPVPLYGRPEGLFERIGAEDGSGLPPELTWAIRNADGGVSACPDRGEIMDGALAGRAPVIAWLASWIEALFVHIQGSARLRMEEGGVRRVSFDGKSGHPYTALARVMVERTGTTAAAATADRLKTWLAGLSPAELREVLGRNRSFIFFRELPQLSPALGPVGAAGVPLFPGRSLAVDRHLVTFHAPIFVDVDPDGPAGRFRRLMIAQDTGSAIVGAARGDIFFGTGEPAWKIASGVRHSADFTLLVPRAFASGLSGREPLCC